MKHSRILLFVLLPLVAACAGSGSASRAVPQSDSATFGPQRVTDSASEATILPKATPVPVSSDLLYVANQGSDSITIYHHDAEGNTPPIATIAGSKTGLGGGGQLSEDAQGTLYVSNGLNILEFAHGAHGNVAPIRTLLISSNSHLPSKVDAASTTVDPVTGKLFVSLAGSGDECGGPYTGVQPIYLARFPPNANGDAAPYAVSAVICAEEYYSLASDSTGNNLIALTGAECCSVWTGGILEFKKQFGSGKPLNAALTINTFDGNGIADDPTTKTYLASDGFVYRFVEGTTGSFYGTPAFTPPLVSTITSTSCEAGPLAIGYLRNIYVICGSGSTNKNTINVYEHDASGAAKPIRVLSGPATKLDYPVGIYEGK